MAPSWCVVSKEMMNDETIIVSRCLVAMSLPVTWHLLRCQKGNSGMDGTHLPGLDTMLSLSAEVHLGNIDWPNGSVGFLHPKKSPDL
jgi:hypothetical protein